MKVSANAISSERLCLILPRLVTYPALASRLDIDAKRACTDHMPAVLHPPWPLHWHISLPILYLMHADFVALMACRSPSTECESAPSVP